jgi:hypothetical protein
MLALLSGWPFGRATGEPLVSADWQTYADERGTRAEYPAGVFSVDAGLHDVGVGQRFSTPDGRAHLAIYALRTASGIRQLAI